MFCGYLRKDFSRTGGEQAKCQWQGSLFSAKIESFFYKGRFLDFENAIRVFFIISSYKGIKRHKISLK